MTDIISPEAGHELFGDEIDLELHKSFDMRGPGSFDPTEWMPISAPDFAGDLLADVSGATLTTELEAMGSMEDDPFLWPDDNTVDISEGLQSSGWPATPTSQASEDIPEQQSLEQLMAENARLKALLKSQNRTPSPVQTYSAPKTPPKKISLPQTPRTTPGKRTVRYSPYNETEMSPEALAIAQRVGPIEAMWGAGTPRPQSRFPSPAAIHKAKSTSKRAPAKRPTTIINKVNNSNKVTKVTKATKATKATKKTHQHTAPTHTPAGSGPLRSLQELYAAPFVTLTQEEKALILLPLLQGFDPVTGEQRSQPGTLGLMTQLSTLNKVMNADSGATPAPDNDSAFDETPALDVNNTLNIDPNAYIGNAFNSYQPTNTNGVFDETLTSNYNTGFVATPAMASQDIFNKDANAYNGNGFNGYSPEAEGLLYGTSNGRFGINNHIDLDGGLDNNNLGMAMGAFGTSPTINMGTLDMVQEATAELSNGYATSRQNEALERAAMLHQAGRRR